FPNHYPAWAKAKLPDAFKNAVAVAVEPTRPGKGALSEAAERGRALVEKFIESMHDFELRWLKIRPIHKLGYKWVNESIPGISLTASGFKVNQQCFGYSAKPMPITDAAIKKLK